MHNSKLFQLLRTLESSEIRWLHKFLKSPYHNSNPQYVQLFEYIKKYYPKLEHPKLDKEITFRKLFPKETFDPQKIRKLMHELAILVEEFLVIHHVKNNAFEHRKIFIAELGRRNSYKAFEKETNSLLHELEQEEKRGENHFLESYQLRKQLFGHSLTVRKKEGAEQLLQISKELDNYYFLQKLLLSVALKSNTRIFSRALELNFMGKILEEINNKRENLYPEIDLYTDLHELFTTKNQDIFFTSIRKKYILLRKHLSDRSSLTVLQFLLNFAVAKLSKGETNLISDQFELYKVGLRDEIIVQNAIITNNTFSNIIICGAYLKEYEWAEKFIETYGKFLNENARAEIISFNRANLNFKQQKFQDAIYILTNAHFKNILYLINARMLALECYYEFFIENDSYYDLLSSQINTFEKLIRRQINLSKQRKDAYLNFVLTLRKLVKMKSEHKAISDLSVQKLNLMPVAMKPWLISKIKQLENGEA